MRVKSRAVTRALFAVAGMLVMTVACKQPGDTKWQFAPDMADAPVPKAQSAHLNPPQGSVATDAILYADNEIDAQDMFVNPLRRASSRQQQIFTAHGKKLYNTFCQHCHGLDGKGKGTMTDVYPMAPNLTDPAYHDRKDGYFFHKITFGGSLMPPLGHAIGDLERFKIVLYLRELQEQSRAPVAKDAPVQESSEGSSEEENPASKGEP